MAIVASIEVDPAFDYPRLGSFLVLMMPSRVYGVITLRERAFLVRLMWLPSPAWKAGLRPVPYLAEMYCRTRMAGSSLCKLILSGSQLK